MGRPVKLAPAAETPDFDATRELGVLIENPAERTTLDAERLLEERAARQNERDGTPALELLRAWLADSDGPSYFAVLGEYGMGKTIVCQRLTRELEQERRSTAGLVPLYFDLKKVTGLRTPHVDASGTATTVERVPTLDEVLRECIERGWRTEPGVAKPTLDDLSSRRRARGAGHLRRPRRGPRPPLRAPVGSSSPTRCCASCRRAARRRRCRARRECLSPAAPTSFVRFASSAPTCWNVAAPTAAPTASERCCCCRSATEQVEQYLLHALPELDIERAMADDPRRARPE